MENWINVYEFNKASEETIQWLFTLLDEEKIPYKKEMKENWIGYKIPKYEQAIIIYVPKEYKEKVESYLKEYNNPNNIVYEEVEELKNAFNEDEKEKREYKNRNIAKKILAIIPFAMILIIIICGIILG